MKFAIKFGHPPAFGNNLSIFIAVLLSLCSMVVDASSASAGASSHAELIGRDLKAGRGGGGGLGGSKSSATKAALG